MDEETIDPLLREFGEGIFDPKWRLHNLYSIVDKRNRLIPFRPNEEQAQVIEELHSRNLVLKARQIGFTTLFCLIYLDDCLFNNNVAAAVIAHKLDDASIIFQTKVKLPYQSLPEPIRNAVPLVAFNESLVRFANASSIRVSTSTRSGTVQWLHISEYGKICSMFPEKAREIRTGAIPSAEQGTITIESTAEGNEGDFYDKCSRAQEIAERELGRLDYKFFFYGWIGVKDYAAKQTTVAESPEDTAYFDALEIETGKKVSRQQRNWWLAQEHELGGDMKREYPATPKEAFEQAIEGAYFSNQIAWLQKHKRIGRFPFDPARPVNTFWDLGSNDRNTIWFEQDIDNLSVFVHYYENSGEWIKHYVDYINDWADEHGLSLGKHYLPHDGDVKSVWLPAGSIEVMNNLKFHPIFVKRPTNKIEAINSTRRKMIVSAFDADGCKIGINHLRHYRKEFDERRGVYKNSPFHNEASHAADGFQTFALSGHLPPVERVDPRGQDRYRRRGRNRPSGTAMGA